MDMLTDERAKVRGMQLDRLLKLFEEEHVARCTADTVEEMRGVDELHGSTVEIETR